MILRYERLAEKENKPAGKIPQACFAFVFILLSQGFRLKRLIWYRLL